MLQVDVLGPFVARWHGQPIAFSRMREKALLARLALSANEVSPSDRLVDDLWGDAAPQNATAALQTIVYRLRRALGDAADLLVWRSRGYTLVLDRANVDATRFEQLLKTISDPTHEIAAEATLDQALAMWAGQPLAGLEKCPFVAAQVTRLTALRTQAIEQRLQASLDAGKHRQIIAELEGFVAEHPLREHAWELLMLAHYRSGSQAASLECYGRLRQILYDELAIEPNVNIQGLEQLILSHDPRLDYAAVKTASPVVQSESRRPGFAPGTVEPDVAQVSLLYQVDETSLDVTTTTTGRISAFDTLEAAVAAGIDALREAQLRRAKGSPLPAIGLHLSTPAKRSRQIDGATVEELVRLGHQAQSGQFLVSAAAAMMLATRLPVGSSLVDLGHWTLTELDRPQRVFELLHDNLTVSYSRLRSGQRPNGMVPIQPTSFIGRDSERLDLSADVSRWPLVSLTGVGGVGKTRLAIETAEANASWFRDGVWFCDLSAAQHGEEVGDLVADALGIRPAPGHKSTPTLLAGLRDAELLLVLDNCEHMIASVSQLASRILATSRNTHILATSREPLGVPDERIMQLRPLSLESSPDRAADALTFLVQRSTESGATLKPDEPALLRIARSLDGIPLGLEIAATRLKSLTPCELADRLERRLDVLGSMPARQRRQRSLADAVAWSYELLEPDERSLFAVLSIFRTGWPLEATEYIAPAAELDPDDVAGVLSALVDKSLVVRSLEPTGSSRYRMLETVRSYASTVLTSAAAASASLLHAEYFADLAERAARESRGPNEPRWAKTLSLEIPNLRQAFYWAISSNQPDLACRIMYSAVDELVLRERSDIARWADAALDAADHPSWLQSAALAVLGNAAMIEGRYSDAVALSRRSIAAEPDHAISQQWLSRNVLALLRAGDPSTESSVMLRDLEDMTTRTGDQMPLAVALFDRALIASIEGADGAVECALRLTTLGRKVGSPSITSMGLLSHGRLLAQSDSEKAVRHLRDAIDLARNSRSTLLIREAERAIVDIRSLEGQHALALASLLSLVNQFSDSGNFSQQLRTMLSMIRSLLAADALPLAAAICGVLSRSPLAHSPALHQAQTELGRRLDEDTLKAAYSSWCELSPAEIAHTVDVSLHELLG